MHTTPATRAHLVLAALVAAWRAVGATPALALRVAPTPAGQAALALCIALGVLAWARVALELVRRPDLRSLVLAALAALSFGRREGFDAFDLVYLLAVGVLVLPALGPDGAREDRAARPL